MTSQHFWWFATAATVIVVQACVIVRLLAIRLARRRARSIQEERGLERQRMEVSLAERLAFEKLLSSLWSAFSNVLTDDFDRQVQEALHRIVAFLDVDRGCLLEFTRDDPTVRSWMTQAGPDLGDFPWSIARVRRGDIVSFSRVDELPDAAAVDRATCDAAGITSQIAVPLAVGGAVVGALVLSTTKVERAWQADEGNQGLHLLGEVFAYALSRKQVEHEAQRLRQELAHIGRVSAMGELTASLAHELNQPLTAILNNAEVARRFLAAEPLDLAEMCAILDDIIADDKRAAEVIQRFRRLLKKGDIEYVSLDLNVLVSEVGRLLIGNAVIRGIPMRLDLAPDLPRVRGDRGQLQQVVLNLVLNAFDAMSGMGAGGGVQNLTIRTHCDGAHAIVEVRDSGTGIAEKDVDQIFEPLYTTKSEGLGMGLAIARTIVDAHGGRLGATNNGDGGATFHFSLPVPHSAT
ncbi:MAG: GAF domain-containing sensor histidine kinase [Candidatus Rokubacteria bacterium]|nr:GAF domain-containing sensor histidine kinase [Candidatus Rokubacteria bacterium]